MFDSETHDCHYNNLTFNARLEIDSAVRKLDESFVGTDDYIGMAFFWSHTYKYTMRDVGPMQRQRIHAKLLAAGEKPAEGSHFFPDSDVFGDIIEEVTGTKQPAPLFV